MPFTSRTAARGAAATLVATMAFGCIAASPAVAAGGEDSKPVTPKSYHVPTTAEINAKRAEASNLASKAKDQLGAVKAARTRLSELQVELEQAMADEAAAQQAEEAALADKATQEQRLKSAEAALQAKQDAAGQLAAATYRGDQMSENEQLLGMLTNSGDSDIAERLHLASLVGQLNQTEITDTKTAKIVQRDASARAKAAATAADEAHQRTVEAQTRVQNAVNKQTEQLMLLAALQEQTQRQADQAAATATRMAKEKKKDDAAKAAEAARKAAELARSTAAAVSGSFSSNCRGGEVGGYANGRLPLSRLCPLYGAPGHYLRADAARAFNRMSMDYAAHFGAPICVTDSYRPYWLQVQLKREKPRLAARPGTSNHGRARAVDLCGGAESFGTAQYNWLRNNAGGYKWCAPFWARSDGSKPEPWHWQYDDCWS